MGGGGGFGDLFIFGLFAFVAVTILSSLVNNRADDDDGAGAGNKVAVAKLQVGLLGSARSLQRDLDRIAGKADTSTPAGLHFVLQGKGREGENEKLDSISRTGAWR